MHVVPPQFSDIVAARTRIAGDVRRTPLECSDWLSDIAGVAVFLKLECWQHTRSFKVRGALNALAQLSDAERARGLVTASAGNHGQAVAYAARQVGAQATIFVPVTAPTLKQERIRSLGAELRVEGASYDEAEEIARAHADATEATFVHAFSDPTVIAGQGTVALEILEDLPDVCDVLVPVGGGGLVTGMGVVMRKMAARGRVIGVQSTETNAMHAAFEAGRAVDVPVPPTLADGLAGCTDEASYQRARAVVDDIVLVSERMIARAVRGLYSYAGVTAEGSGAVGAACILQRAVQLRGPAVVTVTGGNIDASKLAAILSAAEA